MKIFKDEINICFLWKHIDAGDGGGGKGGKLFRTNNPPQIQKITNRNVFPYLFPRKGTLTLTPGRGGNPTNPPHKTKNKSDLSV